MAFDPEHDRFLVVALPPYPHSGDTLALYFAPLDDTLRFSRIAIKGPPRRIPPLPTAVWDQGRGTFEVVMAADAIPLVVFSLHTRGDPHWAESSVTPDPGAGTPSNLYLMRVVSDPLTGDLFLTGVKNLARTPAINEVWRLAREPVAQWMQIPAPPDSAWSGTLVMDTRRRRLILHGGYDRHGVRLPTTRSYDLASSTWEVSGAPTAPGPRSAYAIAYDHARDRVLMFGGHSGRLPGWLNDLWARNSHDGSWSEITSAGPSPAPRAGAHLVEDEQRSRFLLVGGWQGYPPPFPTDVWQLTTEGPPMWTQIATVGTPPDRVDGAFLDGARERLIIHGAVSQPFETGEWELTLGGPATWRRLPVAGDAKPPEMCGFAFDQARDRALRFGGYPSHQDSPIRHDEVWGFSLASDTVKWEKVSSPNLLVQQWFFSYSNRGGIVIDPVRDRLLSFGGYGPAFFEWKTSGFATALSLSGSPTWTDHVPEFGGPPPTTDQALAYDPIRDSFVLFGAGRTATTFEWLGEFAGWPAVRARVISPYPPAIRLEWSAPSGPVDVVVKRRLEDGAWRSIGIAHRAADGLLHYTDAELLAGRNVSYRLLWPAANGEIPVGEVTLTPGVPTESAVRIRDNPARESIAMDLDLPVTGPVRVELLDLSGRRLRERRLESRTPGRQPFQFTDLEGVPAGLYFVRVSSPAGVRNARVTLLR